MRAESAALGKYVAILQDLCGPKIRTGRFAGGGIEAVTWDVGVVERPPMRTVPAYAARRAAGVPGWSA